MNKTDIKPILQELIDKEVSLDAAANILWQWKRWKEAKENERYAAIRDADADTRYNLSQTTERNRLQLEHYLIVGRISQDLITRLIRPLKIEN